MIAGARVVGVGGGLAPGVDADVGALVLALEAVGVPVASQTLVEADEAACEQALAPGAPLTVIVATAGGPEGDIVRRVVARVAGTRLVLSDRVLALLQARHHRIDRPVPRAAERQALLPQGAMLWESGDAEPAWVLETPHGTLAVLPRDRDLSARVAQHLLPFVQARHAELGALRARVLRTTGVALAEVEERLGNRLAQAAGGAMGGAATTSLCTSEGEVWVRIRARGATAEAAEEALAGAESAAVAALGEDCYGRDDERLEQVVGRLLRERDLTLAVAESCTGGLVGDRLTNIAGSSAYFERGVIVYSNRAKQELLGVSEAILQTHGAVSAPCAEAMVRGIRERTGCACGLAITGIAGPDGGTPTKPVGTVFIGVSVGGAVEARRFVFLGDRRAVKVQSAQAALDLLRRRLLALDPRR